MSISDKDRKFLNLLQQETLRIENRRACDRPAELKGNEMKVILSLSDSVSLEEACDILRPLYQQYKGGVGKRVMPELIIRGIYFIIFREMSKLLLEDKERCKKERKWLSDESDGKLRNRILTDCTNKVYKLLGEKSSKVQERFGIQPLRDFTMLYYEPVGFHIRPSQKDEWFRSVFLNIVYHADYAMFIDLTGDDTIFGDIYYGKREVVCCHDSVTANFYYALQLQFVKFTKRAKEIVENMNGSMEDIVAEYQSNLNRKTMKFDGLTGTDKEQLTKLLGTDLTAPVIPTYPLNTEDIDIELAVQYMVVVLDKNRKLSVEKIKEDIEGILQNQIKWLRERLKDTIISWCSVKEMLSKIDNGNVSFLHIEKGKEDKTAVTRVVKRPDFNNPNARHYTYFEKMQDTILREKEELRIECIRNGMTDAETEAKLKVHEKNKEKRTKRGFLFFDYNVRHSDEDAKEFFQFIKRNDCRWAFVCDRTESYWLKRLAEVSPYKIAVDMENPYSNYVHIRGYCDIVIITNVEVRGIMIEPIKRMLGAFDISDEKLINSLITKEILTETE